MYDKEVEKRDGFRGVVERYWSSGGITESGKTTSWSRDLMTKMLRR